MVIFSYLIIVIILFVSFQSTCWLIDYLSGASRYKKNLMMCVISTVWAIACISVSLLFDESPDGDLFISFAGLIASLAPLAAGIFSISAIIFAGFAFYFRGKY